MNRGGESTDGVTPQKDAGAAGAAATKSGRKVKRPAHFDDSPDKTKKSEAGAAPEVAKKSARKTLHKEDAPKSNGDSVRMVSEEQRKAESIMKSGRTTTPAKAGGPETDAKKSARKTLLLAKDESAKKGGRKTMVKGEDDNDSKESSPEPEVAASTKKTARRTLLKSAVKNASSVDQQEQDSGTPKKKKSPESEAEAPVAEAGVSRTGRKIKVPAHLKEFDDVVVPVATAAVKKEPAEVAAPRKSIAPKPEAVAPKTPGRGRSLARKVTEDEPEEERAAAAAPKTPGRRGKSIAAKPSADDPSEDPLAVPAEKPVAAAVPKTPKRAKSLAPPPESPPQKSPVKQQSSSPTKTPHKQRAKSLAPAARNTSPEPAPKTPRAAKLAAEDSAEPTSRSGRKIKPKKYFGDFEEEEAVPAVPVTKPASPVKVASKAAPKVVASPVKPTAKVSSPVVAKKDLPKTVPSPIKIKKEKSTPPSPVKRVIATASATVISPPKKAKLEPPSKPVESEKKPKISPNTEERQITVRGRNDHHHHQHDDKDKDPLASGSSSAESVVTVVPAEPEKQEPTKPQQKRARKTLPAQSSTPEDEDEPPKAPKTPSSRKTIVPAAAVPEDAGSSRSGRKIKPKKFFGDDGPEPVPAAAAAPKTPTAAGRGRRKTLAAAAAPEPDSPPQQDKKQDTPVAVADEPKHEEQPAIQQPPLTTTSREEVLSIVGVVGVPEEQLTLDDPILSSMMAEHDALVSLEGQLESLIGSDQPPSAPAEPSEETPMEGIEHSDGSSSQLTTDEPVDEAVDLVELLSQPSTTDLAAAAEEEQQPAQGDDANDTEGNFQGTGIEQTAPETAQTTEPEAPNDRVPLVENPPIEEKEEEQEAAAAEIVAEEGEPQIQQEEESEIPESADQPVQQGEESEVPVSDDQPVQLEEELVPGDEEPQTVDEQDIAEEQNEPQPLPEENVVDEQEENPVQEAEGEPEAQVSSTEPQNAEKEVNQAAEVSASSNFSEALRVEEEAPEQSPAVEEEKHDDLFESVEFLEDSAVAEQSVRVEQVEAPAATPDIEEDLDKTEPPAMDDLDDEQEEGLLADVQEPTDDFLEENDRDNESITVLPSTPKTKPDVEEEGDLIGKAPVAHSSQATVAIIEIPDTPMVGKENLTPATPKTPESKPTKVQEDFSPDKPDTQEEANVPQAEIIEISDSPIVTLLEPGQGAKNKRESATSTPLKATKLTVQERLIQASRKRSLSASDADITKKNVTFHSPANSTILVDTIDERLKKSFKNEGASMSAQRKRSLSEHKDTLKQDGVKPPKISKLPNFKSIHENQFSRMESIDEYHNRKVQRAKEVLSNSAGKSPAAAALAKKDRTTPNKSSTFGAFSLKPSGTSSAVMQLKFGAAKPANPHHQHQHPKPLLSDEARQEKRQKQFQAAFKPKSVTATTSSSSSGPGSAGKDTSDGARRVVEQSRHKQHQILKGVRTNKRFELLMKFRDAHD